MLTQTEVEDAQRREEADRTREDGRKKFAREIASRVDGLREAVHSVKGDLMGKGRKIHPRRRRSGAEGFTQDGLTKVFGTIKVTPDIRQLPSNYQAVIEWARMSYAPLYFYNITRLLTNGSVCQPCIYDFPPFCRLRRRL
jgi:hypothetical protein